MNSRSRRKAKSAARKPGRTKQRGLFLSFEGGEGAGKSTQIHMLVKALEARGHQVVQTREPGGTEIADRIRSMILDPSMTGLLPLAELFLYEASRAQHVEEKIRPALAKGQVVICDRFVDSSVVYQGAARGLDGKLIRTLNKLATSGLLPRITFLLDIDPVRGFDRVGQRGAALDRMEAEGLAFHRAVRNGYRKLAKSDRRRIRLIDASKSAEKVHALILKQLEGLA